jgi:tRNA A37 threonylcarbamoyladenosine modification protein TsaB
LSAILSLDAAGPRAGVAILDADGAVRARRIAEARTGVTEILPQLLESCLTEAGIAPQLVAVTIGPMPLRWPRVMPPPPGWRCWV